MQRMAKSNIHIEHVFHFWSILANKIRKLCPSGKTFKVYRVLAHEKIMNDVNTMIIDYSNNRALQVHATIKCIYIFSSSHMIYSVNLYHFVTIRGENNFTTNVLKVVKAFDDCL